MSIIGNPILLGGGGGGSGATVTFHAPKNSWIVYSGPESGTISMGSSTQASAVLPIGTYTFVSHLNLPDSASTTADTVIYTATVAVTDGTIINLYPQNYLYWYGITNPDTGGWYYKTQSSQTFAQGDNSLKLTWGGSTSGGRAAAAIRTQNSITFEDITSIKFRSAYENHYDAANNPRGGYSATAWTSIPTTATPLTVYDFITTLQYGQEEKAIPAPDASGFVGVSANLSSAVIYAIWAE